MKIKTKYREIKDGFSLKNNSLFNTISKMEPKSVINTIPITWNKAVDFSVWDDKGNKWIDMTSGIFVTNAGHSNPKIKKAIKDQLDSDMLFAYNYPTKIKHKFISKLLSISPSYYNSAILLNSGSEAMDIVYKLIKLYGQKYNKKYIITFKGNYHGRGLSNDLVSGSIDKAKWSGVGDNSVIFLDFPYNEEDVFDPTKLPPAEEIAGFIVETFQGWGEWFYPQKYIKDLYQFAKKSGALVSFDEMQAGFYRLGPIYGYMTYGKEIRPDIIGLGKGISSSLPISAVLSRKDIVNIDEKADLHGTHSGNALACAAGLANLEFLSSSQQIKLREKTMKVFEKEMSSLLSSSLVKKINVRGMMGAIIFDKTEDALRVVKECIYNGVLPVCTNKNSIKIAPPLTISTEALLEAFKVIKDALGIRE
ncbi:MAG: aspartate aminotransferase family protein [Patescibacteria group bacterium]|nr:aspartate aminotransferase family protein [Patescibacteria group bacterium]